MYLLGIDVGTSGTKSIIFDINGKIISKAYVEYPLITPKTGWIEQDPEIWWDATIKTIKNAIEKASIKTNEIDCIGLSGHTNTPSFIDKNGKPLYHSIVWMDRRAEKQAQNVYEKIGIEKIHKTTGVKIDPFYSVYKVLWLKDNNPSVIEKIHAILQPKDYIGLKLTGEFFLDKALASSSGYLDINKGEYAYDLLEEIGFPIEKLPKLVLPYEIVGEVTEEAAKLTGLRKGTLVVAGSGDVMVNAIGCGTIEICSAYNKMATASDIVVCIEKPIFDPKTRVVFYNHIIPNKWLLVGGSNSGICYRWFRDKFGIIEKEIAKNLNKDPYEIMDAEAENIEPGSNNLIFLPYLTGARSPIWDTSARGVFFGISLNHDKNHFIRSILEGIAYDVKHRIEIIEKEFGIKINEIRIVGGGGKSSLWRQIMADIYNKTILLPSGSEQECLGAAIIAGYGAKIYEDITKAVKELIPIIDRKEPKKGNVEKYDKLFKIYVELYDKLKESFHLLSLI